MTNLSLDLGNTVGLLDLIGKIAQDLLFYIIVQSDEAHSSKNGRLFYFLGHGQRNSTKFQDTVVYSIRLKI